MRQAAKIAFRENGWTALPYQFDAKALTALSTLNPHAGRGRRLINMSKLADLLPRGFKQVLSEFDYSPTPLRAVGFNKSAEANWSLPWHQDRLIAMAEKITDPALKNWSRKSGVWHCEPSASVLEQIAFA